MPLTNITTEIGEGTSIVGPTFWAHLGSIIGTVIGIVCGFTAVMFLVATLASKWLLTHRASSTHRGSSTRAVELDNVPPDGENRNTEPAPAARMAGGLLRQSKLFIREIPKPLIPLEILGHFKTLTCNGIASLHLLFYTAAVSAFPKVIRVPMSTSSGIAANAKTNRMGLLILPLYLTWALLPKRLLVLEYHLISGATKRWSSCGLRMPQTIFPEMEDDENSEQSSVSVMRPESADTPLAEESATLHGNDSMHTGAE
ncbi:hypothetical protein L211DRAFT_849321 [Terfezia boudieri ATCC MYA-4762]|uniref:Uncharacterized protein n=1 Tax=Terfezia boudieri ATCC MYA-4762 TaxID=1051890 RepID=A0A3N4LSJ2_9PEZI|nr:hypothetical protein L211DRAFT_849321 [Terfezia boudieri ATCC MYA-4762]